MNKLLWVVVLAIVLFFALGRALEQTEGGGLITVSHEDPACVDRQASFDSLYEALTVCKIQ